MKAASLTENGIPVGPDLSQLYLSPKQDSADYDLQQNTLDIMNDDDMPVGAGSPRPSPIYRPRGDPQRIPVNFLKCIIGLNRHQAKRANPVILSAAKDLCAPYVCLPHPNLPSRLSSLASALSSFTSLPPVIPPLSPCHPERSEGSSCPSCSSTATT